MKIVHITNFFHPLIGYQEIFLAKEQVKEGHDVNVITSDRYDPILYSQNSVENILGKRIKATGLFVEEGIKVWRLKILFEVPHGIWMRGLENKIQELEPDVVIVHGIVNFSAIRIAMLKKKLNNFKLIYDDHMTFGASRSKMKILYPIFKWTFAKLIYSAADALVGVSQTSKIFMNKRYGFPLEDIENISLGADDVLFRFNNISRQEIRNHLGINESDVIFIYAGKIIPIKGPHILVDAAIKLMGKYNTLKVFIVGNGPQTYIKKMKQDIKADKLEAKFIWHDAVTNKELYKFYSASDVAVWPREASLSMMEAMACNLPIIISNDSEVQERVEYNNGLTYNKNNPSDLAQQMKELLNPKLRKKMGNNGRKLVEEKFNWRVISKQFLELVELE